ELLRGKKKEEKINRLEGRQAQRLPLAAVLLKCSLTPWEHFALSLLNSPFQGVGNRSQAWGQKAFDRLLEKH
ncbi:hypothetical protein ACQP3D_28160, partial [Escherichia coli]